MKKYLSIIAILLILCFTFAACDQFSTGAMVNPENTPEDEWNGPLDDIEDAYTVDYNEIVSQWLEYVSFSDNSEAQNVLSSSELLAADDKLETSVYGYLLVTSKNEEVKTFLNGSDIEPTTVMRKQITSIYDLRSGSIRETYVSRVPVTNGNGIIDPSNYSVSDFIEYDIDIYTNYGFYRVEKTVLVLRDSFDTEVDGEPDFDDYVEKSTFSYYTLNGDAILLDSETASFDVRSTNNTSSRYLLDLEDTTYLIEYDSGNIIREFALGEEYDIPVYNENAITLADGYTYFEEYGFKYVLTESQPITQKLGDLTMYTIPGMTVTVFDDEYKVLVDYTTDCYHVAGYAVLGNGVLYICEYELLPSTATEFDFQLADMKFNAIHKLVNPQSGNVESCELDYVVSGLFNNVTTSIRSFTTISTANVSANTNSELLEFKSLMDTCSVKDGYTLAQVQKIEKGSLATESVFVVLDDKLNIVAELPKFMPNQIGYASFVDDGMILVNVTATDNKTVSYMIDVKEGNASLFVHEYLGADRVTVLDDGYYFNGIVFDKDWNALCDFNKEGYTFKFISNDKIYYTEYNESDNIVLNRGYITNSDYWGYESDYYFATETYVCVGDTINVYDDYLSCYDNYEVQVDEYTYDYNWWIEYYNLNGDVLLKVESSNNDSLYINGDTAYYSGSVSVNISTVADGVHLVTLSIVYDREDTSGVNDENLANFPESYTKTTYYIFK